MSLLVHFSEDIYGTRTGFTIAARNGLDGAQRVLKLTQFCALVKQRIMECCDYCSSYQLPFIVLYVENTKPTCVD